MLVAEKKRPKSIVQRILLLLKRLQPRSLALPLGYWAIIAGDWKDSTRRQEYSNKQIYSRYYPHRMIQGDILHRVLDEVEAGDVRCSSYERRAPTV